MIGSEKQLYTRRTDLRPLRYGYTRGIYICIYRHLEMAEAARMPLKREIDLVKAGAGAVMRMWFAWELRFTPALSGVRTPRPPL